MVTGAAGFVGKHLINELLENGHDVVAVTNTNEKQPSAIKTFVADLTDKDAVSNNIKFDEVDAVIHLAGLAAVGPSFDQPLYYLSTNAGIQINLFEACLAQNAKPKFLVISSGSLYDPKQKMPLNESSRVLPSSPYSVSKVAQESLATYYGNRGFEYIIARPFNHMGPGQNPGFIVPDFAQQIALGEKGEVSEIMVGNLEAKRDYTDVRDIAHAYRLLVESNRTSGQIFNICSGNSVSGKEILDSLLAESSAKLTVKQDPDRMRPSDIPEIIGNHNKITQLTSWEPKYSLQETLSDALKDWRNR